MGGGFGTDTATPAMDMNKFAVKWSDINQDLWYQKLTVFQGRDDNSREINAPNPLQCYMLQQDLWLLEAMFRIIRQVNGGSNANDLSKIKQIDHVVFGQNAGSGKLGALMPVDPRLAKRASAAAEGAGLDHDGGGDDDPFNEPDGGDQDFGSRFGGGDRSGGTGSPNMALGGGAGKVPYHNRYVDLNFEPIAAEAVKAIINGDALPDTNLELIVAKRIPFRIALKMDEREIANFMAACANSDFAFEIQQVRWNKHKPGGAEFTLSGGAGAGAGGAGGDFDF